MYIKWITCQVPSEKMAAFAAAQAQWTGIASTEGLIGQWGGWDRNQPGTACILSIWQNYEVYSEFMRNIHDAVVASHGQAATYEILHVNFFKPKLTLQGVFAGLTDGLPTGRFLRAADCRVRTESLAAFEEAQVRVWIPAMAETDGMLGGVYSIDVEDAHHVLVLSAWDTEEHHSAYTRYKVPALREASAVAGAIENMQSRFVELEGTWHVLPVRP